MTYLACLWMAKHPDVPSAAAGDPNLIAILGSMYTCLSVIVVFQMFALQMWLQDAQELGRRAWDTDERVMSASVERSLVSDRVKAQKAAFPNIQLGFLGTALLLICGIALKLAASVRSLSFLYTGGPVIVLLALFIGVTLAIRRKGMAVLDGAEARLHA